MNIDIKRKWIEALRSGKYKQGRFTLFNPIKKEYCAMGVLRAIDPNYWSAWKMDDVNVAWVVHLNDYDHKSFNQIADWIEKNL